MKLHVAGDVRCQDIVITQSAQVGTNLTVTNSCTAGSYIGLPIGGASINGICSAGDGLTITNGLIKTKPIRLLVGSFNGNNVNFNFNSNNRWLTWDTTINSNGISHTSSTANPLGSMFFVNETGVYHINVLLRVQGVGGRHGLVLDLITMTGTTPVRPPVFDATYGICSGYCRASQTSTRRLDMVGPISLVMEQGQMFELVGRCVYNTNTSAVNVISGSYVRIERQK